VSVSFTLFVYCLSRLLEKLGRAIERGNSRKEFIELHLLAKIRYKKFDIVQFQMKKSESMSGGQWDPYVYLNTLHIQSKVQLIMNSTRPGTKREKENRFELAFEVGASNTDFGALALDASVG